MQPLTYSQAITGFFLAAYARRLSQATIDDYQNTLIKKFQPFLKNDPLVQDIGTTHIEAFLASQTQVSKKTLLNYHTGLSAFWTWSVKEKIAPTNIIHDVEAPKPETRDIVPYSKDEIRALLSALDRSRPYTRPGQRQFDHALLHPERNRAIILLLLDTGLRASELCSIKLRHIDKRNQRIYIMGKGSKERHVPFSVRTHQAIWRYLTIRTEKELSSDAPLFEVAAGKTFKRDWLYHMLVDIGERAGVADVTVHRFRHTFAIQYLRNGGDPYTLQRMLGHSSLDMTKRYLQIAQTDVENMHKRASPVDNWAL